MQGIYVMVEGKKYYLIVEVLGVGRYNGRNPKT